MSVSVTVPLAELGYRIYFTSVIEMARRMAKAMNDGKLAREMNNLVRPTLLILDEVGYLALDAVQRKASGRPRPSSPARGPS